MKSSPLKSCLKALDVVQQREQAGDNLPALVVGQLDAARADCRWRWQELLFGGHGAQERFKSLHPLECYVDGAPEWIGFRKARLDHAIAESHEVHRVLRDRFEDAKELPRLRFEFRVHN